MKAILIYDGSFAGFLSAVYKVFDENLKEVSIVKPKHYVPDMFVEPIYVESSEKYAKRVWHSLQLKVTKHGAKELYKAFLSEIKGTEDVLLKYIVYAYASESFIHTDFSNVNVLRVSQVAKMVTREMHHIQDYLEFKATDEGVWVAAIQSGFDILPLVGNYFRRKYPDQKWLIYDQKRSYGLYFDLLGVKKIHLNTSEESEVLQLTFGNKTLSVGLFNSSYATKHKKIDKPEMNY
ncbi:TIGR03915 family putative DNA repair protein [Galbibacter sp. EGI 63066]|uniref:TIGR03915 family putative DNA repair protein n=1 Tax=Galbibacter sp. EGI 63066 TaxID=2993559 RepID=UPI002248CDF9|nr:TIGR03915 family putative DNA repair protein [Galbibacter sp. EGI 63066]MCX2679996.1 TIGR03915 family putative DNA repair protein [Galbibacter sp. EGI 63066]